MSNRVNFFYLQKLTEAELDLAFQQVEDADHFVVFDHGLVGVANGLGVTQAASPAINALVGLGIAHDPIGQRCASATNQTISLTTDTGGAPTAVVSSGNEKWLSIYVTFTRVLTDPRTDGHGNTVNFLRSETVTFTIRQGVEALAGTAVRPTITPGDGILLADIKRTFGQTQILNADIDITRRQDVFVAGGSPRSVRRGIAKDAVTDLLSFYNAHVTGSADRHTAAMVDYGGGSTWADSSANPAATVEAQLDKIIADLAATTGAPKIGAAATSGATFSLSSGSVKTQLDALLGFLNALAAGQVAYDGSPNSWADGTGLASGTVNSGLDEVVTDLGGSAGSARIGSPALTAWLDGAVIGAGGVLSQLNAIITGLAEVDATSGAAKVGNDAYNPAGIYDLTTTNVRAQLRELLDHINTVAGGIATAASAITYAGSGNWLDGTAVTAANVEAAIDEVVTDLVSTATSNSGADRTGISVLAWPIGGGSLAAGALRAWLGSLVGSLTSQASPTGGERIGNDAYTPSSGLHAVTVGSMRSQIRELLDGWTDNDGTGTDGAGRIGGKAVAGSPYAYAQGSVRDQLDYILNLLNTGIGSNAWKDPARASMITNVTVANPGTASFDGVTLSNGEILLLLGQTAPAENGLWIFNGSGVPLTRPTNFDANGDVVPSMVVAVQEGTARANHIWQLTTNGPIVLGTTGLVFEQVWPLPSPYTFAGQFRAAQFSAALAVDWNNSNVQYKQLTNGDNTFTFANPLAGGVYHLILKQPSSGAKGTVTWPASVRWPTGRAPELSFLNDRIDVVSFVYDGTSVAYLGSVVIDLRDSQTTSFVDFVGVSTNWIVPAGVTSVTLEAIGAGGGGAGEAGSNGGAGGGGGSYAKRNTLAVTPGAVLDVQAGVAGVGGAATPTSGTAGTHSQVTYAGSIVVRGGGGDGGTTAYVGGAGGASNIGDTIFTGGSGDAAGFNSNSSGGGGGAGSTSNGGNGTFGNGTGGGTAGSGNPAGGGGGNGTSGGAGGNGSQYGGGGGGGRAGGAGGNGANGIVRITWVTSVEHVLVPETGRKTAVRAATTAALADAYTYANGSAGFGATLTKTTNGAFPSQDGITLAAGERILLKNQATGAHNGLYILTQLGDGSSPWILTRVIDACIVENLVPSMEVAVQEGTVNVDSVWMLTTNGPLVIGTTALVFASAYQVGAGEVTSVVSITNVDSPYSASWGQTILADTSGGSITVNMPTSIGNAGKKLELKKKDAANSLIADGFSAQTIDDAATDTLSSDNESRTYRADGANVQVVAKVT